jgi:16S rRNA (cytidine1402-2'-O)-methyltransferase
MQLGTLYLIPTPISDSPWAHVLPQGNKERLHHIKHFMVEKEKPARAALKKLELQHAISELELQNIGKYSESKNYESYFEPLFNGQDMGLLSDAGCPGIADPGSELVKLAHQFNIPVVPLVGPSSIFLALMASGLNGQSFAFHGYLPVGEKERTKKLRELEQIAFRTHQTQIIIETPYRNEQMFDTMRKTFRAGTRLCVALDTTANAEFIKTMTVAEWNGSPKPKMHKRPCVFLFQA